jgi:hypothetical protein
MSNNPLLSGIKLPGRIFQLPSKGVFYKNGELSENVKNGEVHVCAMSALDEITIKNPDQLFSGDAIETVLKNTVSEIEKPSELLAKDVDALLVFLRAVTYGSNYEFIALHDCENAKEHSYVADVESIIANMKYIEESDIETTYTLNLKNGQVVKLKPNRYSQVLDLVRANESHKELTLENEKQNLVKMLVSVVESVNDISDVELITEWASELPVAFVNQIAERVEKINEWGPKLVTKCICRDCQQEFDVDIPINPISFFTE